MDRSKCREMRKRSGGDAENGDSKHPPPSIDRHYIRSCACSSHSGGSGGGICPALSRAPEMFSSLLPLLRACAHTHARASIATLTRLRPGWTLRNLMNLTLDLAIINPRFIIKLSL